MIDVRELRLGNYLLLNNKPVRVGGIPNMYKLIIPGEQYAVGVEEFEPIPMNDELFIKCGFRKENKGYYRADIGHVSSNQYGYYLQLKECASETIRVIKIEYLHQLMNLLFSMKKRELDVEL